MAISLWSGDIIFPLSGGSPADRIDMDDEDGDDSYKGNIKPQCECQSERTYGDHCKKWQHLCFQDGSWMVDFAEADSQRVRIHRGCRSWGTAVAMRQGSCRETPDLMGFGGGCCHCWISGRDGHHGPRFSTQHSWDNSNGAQKLELERLHNCLIVETVL
ncbi:unnamed protein product [Pleuronectes platessa]|uniref:Uncharacterized protein n=1 Tax=Pleuronectes platessa TaxID=8262 RepID=A0A9N7VQV8_PLEPL|nr:unnamed protein product [Pleuronectes platessa]